MARTRISTRASLSPSFPYVSISIVLSEFRFRISSFVWLNGNRQLIPGHEAIGSVVEFGENVKGFEKGDRCAADVGITVSSIVLGTKGLGV